MPIAPLLVQGGLALAGGLLGRRKRAKAPDLSPLLNTINQSATEQKNLITSVRPRTTALGQEFGQNINKLGQDFVSNVAGQGSAYQGQAEDTSGRLTEASAQAGRRRILESQPELTQNTREALAGSGLNRGGALVSAVAKQQQEAGRGISDLNQGLEIQNLQNKQQALRDVFQSNRQAAETATGLNAGSLEKLFASGRQDLIDEALALVDAERNRANAIAGIQGKKADYSFAENAARQQDRANLINTLTGLGGNIAGQLFAKK